MIRERNRRAMFLADLMILIAATAAGLAMAKVYAWHLGRLHWGARSEARNLVVGVGPCLAAWSAAVGILRLRRPRPRHLADQPGAMAAVLSNSINR